MDLYDVIHMEKNTIFRKKHEGQSLNLTTDKKKIL